MTSFNGEIEFKSYNDIVTLIKSFNNYKILGKDESNLYNIYGVTIGDPKKPTIFIITGVHGNEWQPIEPTIKTLLDIENNEYFDSDMNEFILSNFSIAYIPVVNPYGLMQNNNHDDGVYAYSNHAARANFHRVDLNRGFNTMNQREHMLIRDFFKEFTVFSSADLHMFTPFWDIADGKDIVIRNIHEENNEYRDAWANKIEETTNFSVKIWTEQSELMGSDIHSYFGGVYNPYTNLTMAFLLEHVRPVYRDGEFVEKLDKYELWDAISTNLYYFLKTSIEYFEDKKEDKSNFVDGLIEKIKTENKDVLITRDKNNLIKNVIEDYKNSNKRIKTTVIRTRNNQVDEIKREFI